METPQFLQNEKASSYSAQFRENSNAIITNCDKNLLQITTAKLLQIMTKFYYKLHQLLQIATSLLQITTEQI